MSAITSFRGEHDFLSNFARTPFMAAWYPHTGAETGEWRNWPTVEHYFQAAKPLLWDGHAAVIHNADTAASAKRLGRQVVLRADWERIKLDVMLTGIRAKFSRPHLAEKLVATWPHELVEGNTWGDRYWGAVYIPGMIGWEGYNWLGKILDFVREELRR